MIRIGIPRRPSDVGFTEDWRAIGCRCPTLARLAPLAALQASAVWRPRAGVPLPSGLAPAFDLLLNLTLLSACAAPLPNLKPVRCERAAPAGQARRGSEGPTRGSLAEGAHRHRVWLARMRASRILAQRAWLPGVCSLCMTGMLLPPPRRRAKDRKRPKGVPLAPPCTPCTRMPTKVSPNPSPGKNSRKADSLGDRAETRWKNETDSRIRCFARTTLAPL